MDATIEKRKKKKPVYTYRIRPGVKDAIEILFKDEGLDTPALIHKLLVEAACRKAGRGPWLELELGESFYEKSMQMRTNKDVQPWEEK